MKAAASAADLSRLIDLMAGRHGKDGWRESYPRLAAGWLLAGCWLAVGGWLAAGLRFFGKKIAKIVDSKNALFLSRIPISACDFWHAN